MKPMIKTKQLTKRYRKQFAVKEVSLHVKKGDIYGFLGLNGAGKTTTLEMLLGLVRPTQGVAYLCGEQVHLKNYHLWEKVGYLLAAPYAYPDLTVKENLLLFARLRGIKSKKQIYRVIDQLKLQDFTHRKVKHLSLGNRVRLGIARALLHEPEILILDEPVNGLDPAGMIEIRRLLQHLAFNDGVTILMSSHLLNEVSKIATTIGIIHEGELIKEMSQTNLMKELKRRLLLKTKEVEATLDLLQMDYDSVALNEQNMITITDQGALQHPEKVARKLIRANFSLQHLSIERENLETFFLRIVHEKAKKRGQRNE